MPINKPSLKIHPKLNDKSAAKTGDPPDLPIGKLRLQKVWSAFKFGAFVQFLKY